LNTLLRTLASALAADDHGTMRGSLQAALIGFAVACTPACETMASRRIPYPETGSGLHVSVVGAERATNERYHGTYHVTGIQVTTLQPGSGGWGWDAAFRWGDTEGEDGERITNQGNTSSGSSIVVDNERESRIYELSLGVRQLYFPDSRLQPYLGVGGSVFKTHNSDHYSGVDPDETPPAPVSLNKHFQSVGLGLYFTTGLIWNVLRDQLYENTEFVIDMNLRGLLGDEFSFVELSIGFGFGK
jgi:hypothetical protein